MSKYEITKEQKVQDFRIDDARSYIKEDTPYRIRLFDSQANYWDLEKFTIEEAIEKSKNLPTPEQIGEGLEIKLDERGYVDSLEQCG